MKRQTGKTKESSKGFPALGFLLFLFLLLPLRAHADSLGDAHISLLEGDVQIITRDTGDWVPASANMPVSEGDRIWVPSGGRLELELMDGSTLRLDQDSTLSVLRVDDRSVQASLDNGRAYVHFNGGRDSSLQMDTLTGSILVYGRARFRVDLPYTDETQVSVFAGEVQVENNRGRTPVNEGDMLTLRGGSYASVDPVGPSDDWQRWNRRRDRTLYGRGYYSSSYLPDGLASYEPNLDANGRWEYISGYGYCWTPLAVSIGWAPYRDGRWVWMGGDYVWVPYESWGWAPSHYGRWMFYGSSWFWVPPARGAVYWGPGYVGWVYTPSYVGWVPLAPREVYYGRGYYGPYSVNINKTVINQTTVINNVNVYRNVRVGNAATVVNRGSFMRGRPTIVKVPRGENPFFRVRRPMPSPDIKPVRALTMPVIRPIPAAKLPPRAIRDASIQQIRERHPFKLAVPGRPGQPGNFQKGGNFNRPKPFERPLPQNHESGHALPDAQKGRPSPFANSGQRRPERPSAIFNSGKPAPPIENRPVIINRHGSAQEKGPGRVQSRPEPRGFDLRGNILRPGQYQAPLRQRGPVRNLRPLPARAHVQNATAKEDKRLKITLPRPEKQGD